MYRDLGPRGRHGRQEGALSGIGLSHQTHVGQQLELETQAKLLPESTRIGAAGRAVGRALESHVASPTLAPARDDQLLPVLDEVSDLLPGIVVDHERLGMQRQRFFFDWGQHVDVPVVRVDAHLVQFCAAVEKLVNMVAIGAVRREMVVRAD